MKSQLVFLCFFVFLCVSFVNFFVFCYFILKFIYSLCGRNQAGVSFFKAAQPAVLLVERFISSFTKA